MINVDNKLKSNIRALLLSMGKVATEREFRNAYYETEGEGFDNVLARYKVNFIGFFSSIPDVARLHYDQFMRSVILTYVSGNPLTAHMEDLTINKYSKNYKGRKITANNQPQLPYNNHSTNPFLHSMRITFTEQSRQRQVFVEPTPPAPSQLNNNFLPFSYANNFLPPHFNPFLCNPQYNPFLCSQRFNQFLSNPPSNYRCPPPVNYRCPPPSNYRCPPPAVPYVNHQAAPQNPQFLQYAGQFQNSSAAQHSPHFQNYKPPNPSSSSSIQNWLDAAKQQPENLPQKRQNFNEQPIKAKQSAERKPEIVLKASQNIASTSASVLPKETSTKPAPLQQKLCLADTGTSLGSNGKKKDIKIFQVPSYQCGTEPFFDMKICDIDSPSRFTFQFSLEKLEDMMKKLNLFYDNMDNLSASQIDELQVGMLTAVRLQNDKSRWYRAEIMKIESADTVAVRFIDYLTVNKLACKVGKRSVYSLHEEFARESPKSAFGRIHGLKSKKNAWCPDSKLFFLDLREEVLKAAVKNKKDGVFALSIVMNGRDFYRVFDHLLYKHYATVDDEEIEDFTPMDGKSLI